MKSHPPNTDWEPLPYAAASRAASVHPPSWLLTFCLKVCLFVFPEKKYTNNIRAFMLDSAEEQQVLQMNLLCSKAAGIVFRAVINTSLWMAKQTLQGTQAPGKEPHGESHFK